MGHAMIRAGLALSTAPKPWRPDVVHAHDWLVAHPAIALAEFFDVPLVSTIHATEAGRHSGWVSGADQPPGARGGVVAGARIRFADHVFGVDARRDHRAVRPRPGRDQRDPQRNRRGALAVRARAGRARGPAELLYFGRLEYEKGVHDAIAALPRIRRTHPGTTLTIAGDGTQQDWLVEQARKHKVLKADRFVGRVDHDELLRLLHRADAAVLPSHYEPFGHRRPGGGRGRHATGHLERRRSRRGGDQRRRPGCRSRPATSAALAAAVRTRARRPARPRSARASAARRAAHLRLRLADGRRPRPRRCIWRPSAANANRSRAARSSSTHCPTAEIRMARGLKA